MEDYLTFRKLVTPVIIQVIFWILFAFVVLSGLLTLAQNFIAGLFIIVVGTIGVRVWAEVVLILFQINDALQEMRQRARVSTSPATPTPPATM